MGGEPFKDFEKLLNGGSEQGTKEKRQNQNYP